MFGWLRPKAECPIEPETREWVDERWDWLEDEFGSDHLKKTRLILPTAEFFPDPFQGTVEDARTILARVCEYMDLDPADIQLSFYADRNPVYENGSQRGTAGLYCEEAGKFRIWVEAANLEDPLALVATLAHELGHVHLLGQQRITEDEDDHEPLTDLLTVFFGLGIFSANSVIREKYWHGGNYSAWSIGRQGYLAMPDYAYALALFARARGDDGSSWKRHLRPDVRAPFQQAMRFLAAENAGSTDAAR